MTPILQIDSVTKTYQVDNNTITAVDDVSFAVNPGEFAALVGPSGSGKTTMLAMLAGLLAPSQGDINIKGYQLGQMTDAKRSEFRRDKIGFTFQANNLVPYLTVLENVELMRQLTDRNLEDSREESIGLLKQLGLGDRLNSLPSQLSGGQQQRVAIARSLIHQPDIVLADEPTASLDTQRAYQVVETFANLIRGNNLAGIMVTHDLRMCQYVDKVIQMRDGKIDQIIDDKADIEAFSRLN